MAHNMNHQMDHDSDHAMEQNIHQNMNQAPTEPEHPPDPSRISQALPLEYPQQETADASQSEHPEADQPPPDSRIPFYIDNSIKYRWAHSPESSRRGTMVGCCSPGTNTWMISDIRQHRLPRSFKTMLKPINHILDYLSMRAALQHGQHDLRQSLLIDLTRLIPPIITAIALDWDSTCTLPFVKKVLHCHEMEAKVFCKRESGKHHDIDVVLSLTDNLWRCRQEQGVSYEPIPICPIVVHDDALEDPTIRLKKWFEDYFAKIEYNEISYPRCRWPVPYFVVVGGWWSIGFAIKVDDRVELFERGACSIIWPDGTQKLMVIIGHVLKSTAVRYGHWFRTRPRRQQPHQER